MMIIDFRSALACLLDKDARAEVGISLARLESVEMWRGESSGGEAGADPEKLASLEPLDPSYARHDHS